MKEYPYLSVPLINNAFEIYILNKEKIENIELLQLIKVRECVDLVDTVLSKRIHQNVNVKLIIPNIVKLSANDKYGLNEFDDYIYEKFIGKKIVLVYGNCHTTVISQVLNKCPQFLEEYIVYPIKPVHTINDPSYFEHPVFRYCDVFIHQSIQLKNQYGEEYASDKIISRLRSGCRVIAIPNLYRLPTCFFPQYSREKEFHFRDMSTIFFRDYILDDASVKGLGFKQIVEIYNNTGVFDEIILQKSFNDFCEKVRMREQDWDIKVLDFILDNYQLVQLFYDPNHPTNIFLKHVTTELLKYMGIEVDEHVIKDMRVDQLDDYEMPIYPAVKEYFNMQFIADELRLTGRKVINRKMDQKDYIKQYLAMEWQNAKVPLPKRVSSYTVYYMMKIYNQVLKITAETRKFIVKI